MTGVAFTDIGHGSFCLKVIVPISGETFRPRVRFPGEDFPQCGSAAPHAEAGSPSVPSTYLANHCVRSVFATSLVSATSDLVSYRLAIVNRLKTLRITSS